MGGFFGVVKKTRCIVDLFYGTDYNSHTGVRRAGMATMKENGHIVRSIHSIENSYFRPKFEGELHEFEGNSGIGVISDTDPQPILMKTRIGKYAIVSVAKLNNMEEIEQELLGNGCHLSEMSSGKACQTELIGLIISQGKDYADGIEQAYKKIKGSFSTLLLTEEGIIAARDYYGRTPVVVGKNIENNGYAVSCESNSFHNVGYETNYFLGPGEIVLITADGIQQLRKPNAKMQLCAFLYIYYGFPTSEYENINVENVRRELGKCMARQDKDEPKTDLLSGIPDSGVGMALGYCEEKKIAYHRSYVKYTPTWPRSFTPSSQEIRSLVARMKLIPNRKMLNGKTAMFCDDSIVRGTQLKDNVKKLYGYGAKEVHIRISCPPLIYGCPFINFSATKSDLELITRRVIEEIEGDADKNLEAYAIFGTEQYNNMVEKIRTILNADSLKFNSMDDLVSAIGLPKEQICTHCFDNSSYGHE
jgi:amidophosphoribosyltransferase